MFESCFQARHGEGRFVLCQTRVSWSVVLSVVLVIECFIINFDVKSFRLYKLESNGNQSPH